MNMRRGFRHLFILLPLLAVGCTSLYDGDDSVVTTYANAVAAADLDGDGRTDLVGGTGVYQDGSATPGYASVVRQTTAGAYAAPARYGLGADPISVAVGDLNGDGRPDLAVTNAASGTLTLLMQSATTAGTFSAGPTLTTGTTTPLDVALGDLNQDGRADVAVAASGTNAVMLFFQSATTAGTFSTAQSLTVSGDPRAIVLGDFSGSGRTDMAVATASNTVALMLQNASPGTFSAGAVLAVGSSPVALRAADLGGTGRLDLITANYRGGIGNGMSVLRQTAPGTFATAVAYDTGDYYATGLGVGDLNGDGRPDVAVACAGVPGDPGSVALLTNLASTPGTFDAPINYRGAWGPMGVAIGDLNADGRMDVVVADGVPYVRFQQTDGSFGVRTSLGY